MSIYEPATQWAKRPADERFRSLEQARDRAKADASVSREIPNILVGDIRAVADGNELFLNGKSKRARLSFGAARNLCQQVGAPHSFLAGLPATLTAQNLNYKLSEKDPKEKVKLYVMEQKDDLLLRDITTMKYKRIYHHENLDKLIQLKERFGLKVPPARPAVAGQPTRIATAQDVIDGNLVGCFVSIGDEIADAGIYLGQGDPELYVVMMSDRQIKDGTDKGLFRSIILQASETRGTSQEAETCLLRGICGNHIRWGVKNKTRYNTRHVGRARQRAADILTYNISQFLDASPLAEEQQIQAAKTTILGKNVEEVVTYLYVKDIASQKQLKYAYALAEAHDSDYADPRSVWGMAQGLTRLSQHSVYADERVLVDKAAGRVLSMAGQVSH